MKVSKKKKKEDMKVSQYKVLDIYIQDKVIYSFTSRARYTSIRSNMLSNSTCISYRSNSHNKERPSSVEKVKSREKIKGKEKILGLRHISYVQHSPLN